MFVRLILFATLLASLHAGLRITSLEGGYLDPNGALTTDGGGGMDPNGLAIDKGMGLDPNG